MFNWRTVNIAKEFVHSTFRDSDEFHKLDIQFTENIIKSMYRVSHEDRTNAINFCSVQYLTVLFFSYNRVTLLG